MSRLLDLDEPVDRLLPELANRRVLRRMDGPLDDTFPAERPVTVRALFAAEVARWVREAPSFFTVSMEDTPDGLLVTLQVRQERDVLQWLLGWGRAVRVLEPASLQRLIAAEAQALWRAHQGR